MFIPIYHYVFPIENRYKLDGIRPIWINKFIKQIEWIQNNYEIIDPRNFISDINKFKNDNKRKRCLITFDDGTKDQFENASKILDIYNIKGIFFVLSDVLKNKKIPLTHLLHIAMCRHKSSDIISMIIRSGLLKEQFDEKQLIKKSHIYEYEKNKSKRILKYLVNYELGEFYEDLKNILLGLLLSDEKSLCESWFGSIDNVKDASLRGHLIGNHGKTHKSYENLSIKNIRNEILHSHNFISDIIGSEVKVFSHPQGGDNGKKNCYVKNILSDKNYKACFSIKNSMNSNLSDIFNISRFDAKDIPAQKYNF